MDGSFFMPIAPLRFQISIYRCACYSYRYHRENSLDCVFYDNLFKFVIFIDFLFRICYNDLTKYYILWRFFENGRGR